MSRMISLLLQSLVVCSAPAAASPTPSADHHIHIRSTDGGEVLQQAREAAGKQPGDAGRVTADRVIKMLDRAGLGQAAVLSNAYMFGMPELDYEDEYAKVRAENDYVASQAARYPDRLKGFYSVDPLADYALEEIERCAADDRLTGLKLHLANAGVDLRDSGHVARLAQVFARAGELEQPVIIHLRTRNGDYGARDARIFMDEVLSSAPGIVVQVAHLGGWSGMDEATRAVVDAFAEAMEQDSDGTLAGIFFDTAETVIPRSRANGREALVKRVRKLNRRTAEAIQRLGPDRVVFGSDWVSPGEIEPVVRAFAEELPLPADVNSNLADNRAPYLD